MNKIIITGILSCFIITQSNSCNPWEYTFLGDLHNCRIQNVSSSNDQQDQPTKAEEESSMWGKVKNLFNHTSIKFEEPIQGNNANGINEEK